jgi:hypothetical protein
MRGHLLICTMCRTALRHFRFLQKLSHMEQIPPDFMGEHSLPQDSKQQIQQTITKEIAKLG